MPDIFDSVYFEAHSRGTHCRDQQFLDFLLRPFQLDQGSVLGVFARNKHVEVFIQMLPVGLAPVQLLLSEKTMEDIGMQIRKRLP